ncbi:hypothetical protein CYJ36_06220 [Bacillus sp. UMB0893]|nr:hypothetical protein CYJ36_06220 [Bacillus sp. UMB0893]
MLFQHHLFQKINWFILMICAAVPLGLFISLNNFHVNIYLIVVLLTFFLAVFLSVLFKHPSYVIKIILLALSIRIVILIVLKIYSFQTGLEGFFPGDVDAYAYHGDALEAIRSHSWINALEGNLEYTYFVAFFYDLFGPDMNIPQLINLGASVLIVPLVYELGNRVGGKKYAITASILWSLFPSAIFWSVSLLKDAFVTLGMVLSGFLILGITEKKMRLTDLSLGICGILLVSSLRSQFLLAIALPILIMICFQLFKGNTNFLRNSVFLVVGIALFSMTLAGENAFDALTNSTSQEETERINEIALDGGSGIALVTMFPPEIRWLVQLPFSIFAPFPWQWLSVGQGLYRVSGLEMIVWYILYYFIWKNRQIIIAQNAGKVIMIYAFSVFIAVSFSLPNIGSIYRYRLAALALLLPLVFYKFAKKKDGKGSLDEK